MVFVTLVIGCTGKNPQTPEKNMQPTDTTYTQKAAMAVYGYQPERALQIIDSAVIVGNISEVRGDVNRARIYSQSQMMNQLDSLLGGPKGVRLDTARAIAERLLLHDSLKTYPKLHQDVLEILIYAARQVEALTAKVQGMNGSKEAAAFIRAMVGVSRENFEATLDLIDQKYDSLSAYIENQLGFSKEEQQQLKEKYLTKI